MKRWFSLVAFLGLLCGRALVASAAEGLPTLDQRAAFSPPVVAAGRKAAGEALRARVGDVRTGLDPITGAPKSIASPSRFLTGPGGEGGALRTRNPFPAGDSQRAVRAFIDEHAALFGHRAAALDAARVQRDEVAAHNGMRTVVWRQRLDGLDVFDGLLKANLTRSGELISIGSQFVADPNAAANRGVPRRAAALAAPRVAVRQAVTLAAATFGDTVAQTEVKPQDAPAGAEKRQHFTSEKLNSTTARLVWLPTSPEVMRLCWEVEAMSRVRRELYRVLVDAQSGETLLRHCLTEYLSDASYRVYTSDSPSPFSPGWSTPNTGQPATVARVLMTTPALNTTASPNGWIDDGVNETRGNNVDAHLDLNADNVADLPRPQGSPNRVFDFPLDLAQEPGSYRDAAVTQLFYWCNFMHDKLYALGFTEAAGNFQNNNFGRGGTGNDAVQADAQDGSGTNNANFSTPSDGSPGRMQMYLFSGPTPDRDGDLDAEIILHEYTHGLSNRLVGGGAGISALQSMGLGEGWSDFYALCLLSEPADNPNAAYPFGAYASYQFGGLTQNYYFGIRRYPYSTDLTKNPLTFKDIDPNQSSAHSGVSRSPISGNTANEVHNVGELWCVTLWEARANVIAKYGPAAGNQLILQLVTDGMKLSPANPTFLEARDAILQADLVNNGGANRNELWAAFAKRGLGASAYAPASALTTGVGEAFDLPDALGVSPTAPFAPGGSLGGPFTPATQTFTLLNSGSTALNWTATKTQSWLSLSASAGTLAAGATTTVVATIQASAAALPIGSFTDTVTFTDLATGAQMPRGVNLGVTPPRMFFFDLATDPGWSRQSPWAYGTPTGGGGTTHGYADPTGGATGPKVFGVNLSGDYSTTVTTSTAYLVAGPFDLTGVSGAKLQFQRWLNVDFQPYVYATVEVSNNNSTWTQVFGNGLSEIADKAWTRVLYDLSAVADNKATVYLRWGHRVGQAGAYAYSGWNIDDIEVLGMSAAQVLSLALPASLAEGTTAEGTVSIPSPRAAALTVSLLSGNTARLSVPAAVTIAAGATAAAFKFTAVDNLLTEGPQTAAVTATASGFSSATAGTSILDDDVAPAAPVLPAQPPLSGGPAHPLAWAAVSGANEYEAQCATAATFAGATSSGWISPASFTFTNLGDGPRYYRVRARHSTPPLVSAWSATVSSTQDGTAPALTVAGPTATMLAAATLQGTATDASGVASLLVAGAPAQTSDAFAHWTATVPLEPGANPIAITAADPAAPANVASATWTITRLPDADGDSLPDAWENAHGLTGADRDPAADPDHDGIPNLLEYAFHLDPNVRDSGGLPTSATAANPADGKEYLTLTYRRLIGGGGLLYVVETSDSLGGWSPAGSNAEPIGLPVPVGDGFTETVTVRLKPSLDTQPARFVHLHVIAQ